MPSITPARALIVFAFGLLILSGGLYAWYSVGGLGRTAGTDGGSGTPTIGGPFELVDQNGETRRDSDFAGLYRLITFGYTFCPDICPATLLTMTEALEQLAAGSPELAGKVVPLFVTVDPERDTVAALKDYAPHFHPDLVALTGSAEQIAQAAKAFRVFYRKAESDSASDYLMDHSSYIFLMGPDGGYVSHFGHDSTSEDMAAKLKEFLGS